MADCSGHLSWVQLVQFSTDGSQLLSCSDDQTVRVSLWLTQSASVSIYTESMIIYRLTESQKTLNHYLKLRITIIMVINLYLGSE